MLRLDHSSAALAWALRVSLLVALLLPPLPGAPDAWSELWRRGVLAAALLPLVPPALFLAPAPASAPLALPLLGLVLVHLGSTLLGRAPALGLEETLRVAVLALLAFCASLAPAAHRRLAAWAFLALVPLAIACGTIDNSNDRGALAAAALVLAVAVARRGEGRKAAAAALGSAALLCLLLSRSRGALLAAAVGLLLELRPARLERRSLRRFLLATALIAAGSFGVMAGAAWLGPSHTPLGESAGGRVALWRAAAALFRERPLLGHGPGSFKAELPRVAPPGTRLLALDAHNDAFQTLAETGALGLLAVLAVLLVPVRRPADRGFQAVLVTLLVDSAWHMVGHLTVTAVPAALALGFATAAPDSPAAAGAAPGAAGREARMWPAAVAAVALLLGATAAPAAWSLWQADRARQRADWQATAERARLAAWLDPARPEAHELLARARLATGRHAEALAAARAGLALAPYDPSLNRRAGEAALLLGERELAERYLSLAAAAAAGP